MSLFVSSINSGSNGNCYYIGNGREAVLVDAGISCRETEKRMQLLGLDIAAVKGLFISHEHIDHIRGVEQLAARYCLPVYITEATLAHSKLKLDHSLVRHFIAHEGIDIGGMVVTPFPKLHDAIDPYSFVVSGNGVTIGVITDIGAACSNVQQYFSRCNAVFLEANYDEVMLSQGHYPYHLKKRISGGRGHISNRQALDLFCSRKAAFMSHLFLSHLSKENNCPDVARQTFMPHVGNTQVVSLSRYEASVVYTIPAAAPAILPAAVPVLRPRAQRKRSSNANPMQMSLFG